MLRPSPLFLPPNAVCSLTVWGFCDSLCSSFKCICPPRQPLCQWRRDGTVFFGPAPPLRDLKAAVGVGVLPHLPRPWAWRPERSPAPAGIPDPSQRAVPPTVWLLCSHAVKFQWFLPKGPTAISCCLDAVSVLLSRDPPGRSASASKAAALFAAFQVSPHVSVIPRKMHV